MSQYDVPVLWSPATRLHDPRGEVWVGVPPIGTETAERVDAILAALDAGPRLVEVRRSRTTRSSRCTRRAGGVPAHGGGAVGGGAVRRAGRPGPRRAVPVPDPRDDRRAARPTGRGRARGRRPVRLRHDDAGRAGDVGGGPRGRRLRDRGRRARGGRCPPAYALCRPPGHHATPAGYGGSCYLNNAAVAAAVLRDVGPRQVGDRRRGRPPRATGRRRSSTPATTCCTGRCTSTRRPAGSPTWSGTPTRPAPDRARGHAQPAARARHRRRAVAGGGARPGWPGCGGRMRGAGGLAGRRRGRRRPGEPAARHGRRLPRGRPPARRDRPAGRRRTGGRLPPAHPRRARRGVPRTGTRRPPDMRM